MIEVVDEAGIDVIVEDDSAVVGEMVVVLEKEMVLEAVLVAEVVDAVLQDVVLLTFVVVLIVEFKYGVRVGKTGLGWVVVGA